MIDGVWTKVLDVVVPSYKRISRFPELPRALITYVLDLFHREVRICGYARLLWLDIDDDQQWVWRVALEELVDLEIGRPQLGSRVVPSY